MQPLPLDRLVTIVGGQLVGVAGARNGARTVHGVAIHSERLGADSVFFALAGASDGHQYVARALHHGAVAAVVAAAALPSLLPSLSPSLEDAGGPLVVVDDPLAALQELARWWRQQLTGTVVAVVGSNGKTVTKDALAHFAASCGRVYASPGSYNSQLGVALSLVE